MDASRAPLYGKLVHGKFIAERNVMGTPEPDAGRQVPGAPTGAPPPEDRPGREGSAAVVIVPTLLGLLGFFAVAAAVTSDAATVNVTAPGLLLAFTALVVAGISPLYALNPTWRSLRRPALLLAACLLVEVILFLAAPQDRKSVV